MFANFRIRLFSGLATALALLGSARAADAAWITIKNDTNRVMVVQSAVGPKGQARRGRPVRLLPGESCREFSTPQAIMLEVYDAQTPNKPILTSRLAVKKEEQTFSIRATSPAGIVVAPSATK
jgi:hypothetical protein